MSILRNINYMKNFTFYPCATPNPLAVIELAFEAALPELWEFFSFQIVQVAKPVAKEMGSRNAPGWTPAPNWGDRERQRSRGHGKHVFADPPDRKSPGEKWGPNTLAFRMVDLEQRALLYWMIVDLATAFMARWTTLMYQHQQCPFDHQCYKSGPFTTIFIGQGEATAILPILNAGTIFSGGFEIQQQTSLTTGMTVAPGSMTVETTLKRFLSDEPPSAAWVEIREAGSGKIVGGGPGGTPNTSDGTVRTGASFQRPIGSPPHSYNVVLVNNASDEFVAVTAGTLHLSGSFCVTIAPALPFDASHIIPRLR
jgi:hypothetical protein